MSIFLNVFPAGELVEKNAKCTGTETYQGWVLTKTECAKKCHGISSMFSHGPNDYDGQCDEFTLKCNCFCQNSAINGSCNTVKKKGYHLYRYRQGNHTIKQIERHTLNYSFTIVFEIM